MSRTRRYVVLTVTGGVHSVPEVDAEPHITLERWCVYETQDGRQHLVGWHVEGREGRVSTSIGSVDATSRIITTMSGRRYLLAGPPGHDRDAAYVWSSWMHANGHHSATDVTSELHAALLRMDTSERRNDSR